MKDIYARTLLYAYPHLQDYMEILDQSAEYAALASAHRYGLAEEQCINIVTYKLHKDQLRQLKEALDKIFEGIKDRHRDYLEYSFFMSDEERIATGFRYAESRTYYRTINSLVTKISIVLEERYFFTDKWFEEDGLQLGLILRAYNKALVNKARREAKSKSKQKQED